MRTLVSYRGIALATESLHSSVRVLRQQPTEGTALHGERIAQRFNAIAELQDFIALRPDAREVRKALAVKLIYQSYLYDEIQTILDVSQGSITGWKQAYEENGIDGLRLKHKARKSALEFRTARGGVELVAIKGLLGSWGTGI